jgi:hypothetical protein
MAMLSKPKNRQPDFPAREDGSVCHPPVRGGQNIQTQSANGAGASSTVVIDGEVLGRRTQQQSATAVLIEAGAPFDAAAIYTNF